MTGAAPRVPEGAQGVLVVEGETDEKYLRIAADAADRPELLQGIHIVACDGVNGVVRQAVLHRENDQRPLIALFDKDDNGKAGRDTLMKRFSFTKHQVLTYADVLDPSVDGVEAEDLWPGKLLQRFLEEYGEDNVLSEKQLHPQLKRWHYGFNSSGKEIIDAFLRDNANQDDATSWVKLIELVRARLGLAIPPAPPPGTSRPRSSASEQALIDEGVDDEEEDDDEDELDTDGVDEEVDRTGPASSASAASLLDDLRQRIFALGSGIREVERKRYINFSRGKRFLVVAARPTHLQLYLALGEDFEDPDGLVHRRGPAEDHPNSVWAYRVKISDERDLDRAFDLIRHAYQRLASPDGAD